MALTVEQGTFTKTTSTSTPVSQQVNLNNSSLVPKALILWTNGSTSTNGTYSENIQWSYGFSDGTNHISQNMTALDNVTTQNEAYSWNTNAVIAIASTAATPAAVSRATVSAFGTGSFTLSWGTQSDTSAMVIHYIVIGGSDITNVSAFSTTYGSVSTGNRSFNGSGTSFTPDFCLTMTACPNVTTANSLSVGGDNAQLNIGAARSTTEQFAIASRTETVGTSDTNMNLSNDCCVLGMDNANGVEVGKGTFVSFDNAAGGGITLNITTATWNTGSFLGFLMFKGGTWETGTFQQRSGTGTQDVSFSNTGLNPEIVFLGGIDSATANASVVNNYICLGASDGTRESYAWAGDQDAQANMVNTRTNSTTKVYHQGAPAATASSSTTVSECDMNDMATAGKFQLSWTTADSTQRYLGFWTIGTAGQALTRTISESLTISHTTGAIRGLIQTSSDSLTLSESIPRIRSLLQTSSDSFTVAEGGFSRLRGLIQTISDSLTLSESIDVLRGLVRTFTINSARIFLFDWFQQRVEHRERLISESLSLTESIERLRGLNQTLSDSFSISESISKVKGKVGIISESLVLTENISRLTNRLKTISQSLTLGETMDRLRGKLRILSESVGLSHDLSRLVNKIRTMSENISLISDTVRTRMKWSGPVDESLSFSESIERLTIRLKTISQSLSFSEAVLGLRGFVKTISSDSISFSEDGFTRLRNKIRTTTDSLTLTDSIQTLRNLIRLLDQSLTLTDSLNRQTSRLRGFTQNLNLSEVIETAGANVVRSISETLDFTHNTSRITSRLRTISESLTISESISHITSKLRTISHSITLTDSVSRTIEFVKMISESVSFSSSHTRITNRLRTISNSLSLSENIQHVRSRIRTMQHSLTLTDSFIQESLSVIIKTISEELMFEDGAQRVKGKLKTISEALSLASDTLKSKPHRIKMISENLNISDSTSRLRLLVIRGMNHNLVLSSTALRTVKSAVKQFIINIRRIKKFSYTKPY